MKNIIKLSLIVTCMLDASIVATQDVKQEDRSKITSVKKLVGTFAPIKVKELTTVNQFKKMFVDAKVSGKIKSMYAGYTQKEIDAVDTSAIAIGGTLKYELAKLDGFNAGFAFTSSNDFASSKTDEQNDELSSSDGSYTDLTEAYINYGYDKLKLRAGRQIVDTPLANSDDIRMIPNTFEAYIARYNLNDMEIMAGNLQRWQGIDAGLDDSWVKCAEDGTWFAGLSYEEDLEFNLWYYNVTKLTNIAYIDFGYNYEIAKDIKLHGVAQYLHESEIGTSGVKADIAGALVELSTYDLTFSVAINKAKKYNAKESFSGFGGGTLFTNMDTMIIDDIAIDRDATAVVAGAVYEYGNLTFLYAYGDFKGKANSALEKAHIVEQNIGFQYSFNKEFEVASICVIEQDKQSEVKTENDWQRLQLMLAYNF